MIRSSKKNENSPCNQPDIASDFFALRKAFSGTRWLFTEGRNSLNPLSHCDIAWAAALATFADAERPCEFGAAVALENCWFDGKNYRPYPPGPSPLVG